jgi:transcriptional regulator with XRE-family HTH domain
MDNEVDFKVDLNPELLIWARLNQGLSIEEASDVLGITPKELRKLELGVMRPSWSFVNLCAKIYKRQSAVFLLKKPPMQDRRVIIGVKLIYSDTTEEYFNIEQ